MTPSTNGRDACTRGSHDASTTPTRMLPRWFSRTVAYCGGFLVIGAVVWVLGWVAPRWRWSSSR